MKISPKFNKSAVNKSKALARLHAQLDIAMREALDNPRHSIKRIKALATIENLQRAIAVLMADPAVEITLEFFF